MITDEQVASYRENGYIVVHDLFSQAEIAGMRQACDDLVERSRSLTANDVDYEFEPGHSASQPQIRRLRRPMKSDDRFAAASRAPKLIDILARLIGPEIRLSHPNGKLNWKQPGYGAAIEWHQDWVGYPHTNEDLLAVGLPLDDVDMDNSPMLVIPGSHKGPIYSEHTTMKGCLSPGSIPRRPTSTLEGRPLHDEGRRRDDPSRPAGPRLRGEHVGEATTSADNAVRSRRCVASLRRPEFR